MSELFLPEDDWKAKSQAWFERYRLLLIAGLGGLFLLFGGFSFFSGIFEQPKVEVLESGEKEEALGNITVEVAGAVVRPGVYELLASDRVERLLIASGGLSAEADRAWIEKNINRAAKLLDGQKIYIPKEGEIVQSTGSMGGTKSTGSVAGFQTGLININLASQSELEKLKGIGPARASQIIENRPYARVDELVSKKVLGKKLFEEIKEQITAP